VTRLEVGRSRNRGLISGRGSVFFLYPKRCNRLWSPPSNLINVYRCKTVWKWNWPQPLLVTRFRKCLVYRHPSLYLHDMHKHTFYFIWTESALPATLIGVIYPQLTRNCCTSVVSQTDVTDSLITALLERTCITRASELACVSPRVGHQNIRHR